jgi:hypothetical protein
MFLTWGLVIFFQFMLLGFVDCPASPEMVLMFRGPVVVELMIGQPICSGATSDFGNMWLKLRRPASEPYRHLGASSSSFELLPPAIRHNVGNRLA